MISAKAISAIEWLFEDSLRSHHAQQNSDHFKMVRATPSSKPSATAKRQMVVLNISSYVFRIVALFDFGKDERTLAHMAGTVLGSEAKLDEQALLDTYSEFVNMICGGVNRKLGEVFRHVGMSTPFFLESDCARFVSKLSPSFSQSYEVHLSDEIDFSLILCVCAAKEVNLDFDVDRTQTVIESVGELELF